MNYKDLKKAQDIQQKEERSFGTWLKNAKERSSRPRITRNIIQPETEETLNNMYGYYSEPVTE
jgi:hypothetical protein